MKVSELIAKLVHFIEENGDRDVWVYDNNCGGHYNCEPFSPLDLADGVSPYQLQDGTQVARIETQW